MVKRIWEQYSSLIQWSVVLLLVLLLLVIWMGGEDDNKVAEEIASVVEPLKPEVVVATAPEPAPEPEPEPAPEPLLDESPVVIEEVEPEVKPEPEPEPRPEPVVEEETVALVCPQWTESVAVSRGSFTSGVERNSREPVDSICQLGTDNRRIFYFSDLHNQFGKHIYHLWEYEGREMAKVSLGRVNGPRWRVWSSKNLIPGWSGEWIVKVVTKDGTILHQESFIYR